MNARAVVTCLVLGLGVPHGLAAAATENEPGSFVRNSFHSNFQTQAVSTDGRVEVRQTYNFATGQAQLAFVERSSGRTIWSTTYIFSGVHPQDKKAYFSPNSKTGIVRDAVIYSDNNPLAKVLFIDLGMGSLIASIDHRSGREIYVGFSPDGRVTMAEDLSSP